MTDQPSELEPTLQLRNQRYVENLKARRGLPAPPFEPAPLITAPRGPTEDRLEELGYAQWFHWSQLPSWTWSEAAALWTGIVPWPDDRLDDWALTHARHPIALEFCHRRDLIDRARRVGDLPEVCRPSEFVKWAADQCMVTMPFEMLASAQAHPEPNYRQWTTPAELSDEGLNVQNILAELNEEKARNARLIESNRKLQAENQSLRKQDLDKLRPALAVLLSDPLPPRRAGDPKDLINVSRAVRSLSKRGVDFTRQNLSQHIEHAGKVLGISYRLIEDPDDPTKSDGPEDSEATGPTN